MYKRLICIFTILVLIAVLFVGCGSSGELALISDENGITIRIDNKEIKDANASIDADSCQLSLVKVLVALGTQVSWENDWLACIKISDRQYELNLKDKTYQESGTTNNFLIPAPGSTPTTFCCEPVEKDIVLDSTTLRYTLEWTGITGYRISADSEAQLITVSKADL
ncbi:MAG: hypothetical protein IJ309_03745 [Clostridia bacterium]|nr:hypothetical protein [Clostridia bacterium]